MSVSFFDIWPQLIALLVVFFISLAIHQHAHQKAARLLGGKIKSDYSFMCFLGKSDLRIPAKQRAFNQDNFQNFKRPVLHTALTLFAGPAISILIALLYGLILLVMPLHLLSKSAATCIGIAFGLTAITNAIIGFLSILPFPTGSDGNHLYSLLKKHKPGFVRVCNYLLLTPVVLFFLIALPPTRPLTGKCIWLLAFLVSLPIHLVIIVFHKIGSFISILF